MNQEQNTETITLSMENVKELFWELFLFQEQEQVLFGILYPCIDTMNQRLNKLIVSLWFKYFR